MAEADTAGEQDAGGLDMWALEAGREQGAVNPDRLELRGISEMTCVCIRVTSTRSATPDVAAESRARSTELPSPVGKEATIPARRWVPRARTDHVALTSDPGARNVGRPSGNSRVVTISKPKPKPKPRPSTRSRTLVRAFSRGVGRPPPTAPPLGQRVGARHVCPHLVERVVLMWLRRLHLGRNASADLPCPLALPPLTDRKATDQASLGSVTH